MQDKQGKDSLKNTFYSARLGRPPAQIDFDTFSKVKKLPNLRAGGGGNWENVKKKGCSFLEFLPQNNYRVFFHGSP